MIFNLKGGMIKMFKDLGFLLAGSGLKISWGTVIVVVVILCILILVEIFHKDPNIK